MGKISNTYIRLTHHMKRFTYLHPYKNFEAINTPTYPIPTAPPPYSEYPPLTGVSAEQPQAEKSGPGEAVLNQNLKQLPGWNEGCCWNGLATWKKTLIIGILLLIILVIVIIVVLPALNFQYQETEDKLESPKVINNTLKIVETHHHHHYKPDSDSYELNGLEIFGIVAASIGGFLVV